MFSGKHEQIIGIGKLNSGSPVSILKEIGYKNPPISVVSLEDFGLIKKKAGSTI